MKKLIAVAAMVMTSFGAMAQTQVVSFACENDFVQVRADNAILTQASVNDEVTNRVTIKHLSKNGVAKAIIYGKYDKGYGFVIEVTMGQAYLTKVLFNGNSLDYKPVSNRAWCATQ